MSFQPGETLKLLIPRFVQCMLRGTICCAFVKGCCHWRWSGKASFGANEMAGRRELHNSGGKWCSGLAAALGLGYVPHL